MRSRLRLSPVAATLAVGVLALAVLLVLALGASERRLSGSSPVQPQAFVVTKQPGGRLCLDDAVLPAGTARLGLVIGTYGRPGPRLTVTARDGGEPVSRGGLAPGWTEGPVQVPIRPVRAERAGVRLCVVNEGPGAIAYGGEPGSPPGSQLSVVYLRGAPESGFEVAGRVADRFGRGKSDLFGAWTFAALVVLVVGAGALAAFTVLRFGRPA